MQCNAISYVRLGAALGIAFMSWVVQAAELAAPNVVPISPVLVTSGQPSAKALEGLRDQGFEAVIYLAPPTVQDAVKEEALIVGRQGLLFLNIPIAFDKPSTKDYEVFAATLQALGPRKVLVHCQINMRASVMTFLYRTLVHKQDPQMAYEKVTAVWSPEGPWKTLIKTLLRQHGVAFEPY
jgi:protein tyrosine phosphatase (PTP) superfamily phosphohydrolase (DUF442 family)